MSHRRFRDADGGTWDVWEVHPSRIERRSGMPTPPQGVDRRDHTHTDIREHLSPELSNGWLAFEGPSERRRLSPIPPAWTAFDENRLNALRLDAKPVSVPR